MSTSSTGRLFTCLVLGLLLTGARPRHGDPQQCDEHCKKDAKECEQICRKYANAKSLKFCTNACDKVEKDCGDRCANKGQK